MSEITNQLIYMPSSDWLLRTNWAKRRIQIRIVAPWQLSVVDCNNQQQKKKKKVQDRVWSGRLASGLRSCWSSVLARAGTEKVPMAILIYLPFCLFV